MFLSEDQDHSKQVKYNFSKQGKNFTYNKGHKLLKIPYSLLILFLKFLIARPLFLKRKSLTLRVELND